MDDHQHFYCNIKIEKCNSVECPVRPHATVDASPVWADYLKRHSVLSASPLRTGRSAKSGASEPLVKKPRLIYHCDSRAFSITFHPFPDGSRKPASTVP